MRPSSIDAMKRRNFMEAALAAATLAAVPGCGGGASGSSTSGGSGGGDTQFAAATLVGLPAELQQRYPGTVTTALASEISSYSVTEATLNPSQAKSMVQGSWLGELDIGGFLRISNFQLINQNNSLIPPGTDVRTGSTEFAAVDTRTGKGIAMVRNARDNLRLDSGSLQMFFGMRSGATINPAFPNVDSLMIVVVGEVTNGQSPVGIAMSIWDTTVRANNALIFGFSASGGQITGSRFKGRYRDYVLQDYAGGPRGLSLDYDVVMTKTA